MIAQALLAMVSRMFSLRSSHRRSRFAHLATMTLMALFATSSEVGVKTVEGTLKRFAHGFLEVRSLTDCKLYSFTIDSFGNDAQSQAIYGAIEFAEKATSDTRATGRKRFGDVIVIADAHGNVLKLSPSDATVDADVKCIRTIATRSMDGTLSHLGYGNNGAGFDLRLASGRVVNFLWVYDNDSPRFGPGLGERCDQTRMTCTLAHPRVRVTYRVQRTGDGEEIVPIRVDAR